MRIGVALSPTDDWDGIVAAARAADELGLDSVGFWDHYHSEQPDWGYVAGWAAHAYLAAVTSRVRILPMVVCNLNHELGQLAKETSVLAIASGGRFELGIGAGDYPVEYRAWGRPFPDAAARLDRFEETLRVLPDLWTGTAVGHDGVHVQLDGAISAPAPSAATRPRIVAGVGGSRRTLDRVVDLADELNVYLAPGMLEHARERVAASGRDVAISAYRGLQYGEWPADPTEAFRADAESGVERLVVNVGFDWDKVACVRALADAQERLASVQPAGRPG
jgi:alkanesulfonate monooxygenase SsuD/methylene tetrahydromethanopterin reductase-like flavin-dependent oxidoreductase (luciferase family)